MAVAIPGHELRWGTSGGRGIRDDQVFARDSRTIVGANVAMLPAARLYCWRVVPTSPQALTSALMPDLFRAAATRLGHGGAGS